MFYKILERKLLAFNSNLNGIFKKPKTIIV